MMRLHKKRFGEIPPEIAVGDNFFFTNLGCILSDLIWLTVMIENDSQTD